MDDTYNSIEDDRSYDSYKKEDLNISDQLVDFARLRISALTKAAEISPLVKEVTIGPNSTERKEEYHTEYVLEKEKNNEESENLIEDKLKEDLRYVLIMKEHEKILKDTSEQMFRNLVENMISKRADFMSKYWKKQTEETQQRTVEQRSRKLQMMKELHENDNLTMLNNAKLDEQRSQMINKQTIENMNRILEEQNKATARFAAITDSHTKICICYNEVRNLLQTELQGNEIFDKHIKSINAVISNIRIIMDLCKTGTITDKEVEQAEMLSSNMHRIKKEILEVLGNLKEQEQTRKREEQEAAKKKEEEDKQAQELKAIEIAQAQKALKEQAKSGPLFYSKQNYSYYEELRHFLEQYESQFKELLENVNLKKFRFDCQKAVNTPINALSSVSGMHIKDKFDKLSKLLKGERVQVLDTYVIATQHPQGLSYCTALLAKKIVRQGDLLISSNSEAAFPLAAVTTALWSQFPEFGKLLEANFHRQCPYVIPMFLPQKEGQTDKDFYLSRGYTYNDEGVIEKQDKFLKRMSGIFRLQCAIWISKTPRFMNARNPHSLRYAWRWLASFINLKPEPDICATLLTDFFSICGSELYKHYGKQFTKIIKLISTQYFAILEKIDEGGPKTRLEEFLQNVLKTGHIPAPSGLLSPNTW